MIIPKPEGFFGHYQLGFYDGIAGMASGKEGDSICIFHGAHWKARGFFAF